MPDTSDRIFPRILRRGAAIFAAAALGLGLSLTTAPVLAAEAEEGAPETGAAEPLVEALSDGETGSSVEHGEGDIVGDGSLGDDAEISDEVIAVESDGEDGDAVTHEEEEVGLVAPMHALSDEGDDHSLELDTELSSDDWLYYFVIPEPVVLSPGVPIRLNAAPGFWTTGPGGSWGIQGWEAVVFPISNEGFPALGIELSALPSDDGSALIVTPPADFPTSPPSWLAYYEFVASAWVDWEEGPAIQASARATLGGDPVTPQPEPNPEPSPEPELPETGGPNAALSTGAATIGGTLTVNGSGFAAGEALEVWLHSTPQRVGTSTAGSDGSFSIAVTIPAGTPAGAHRIEVRGIASGSVWVPITVTAASSSAPGSTTGVLANTGGENDASAFALGAGILLLIGVGLMVGGRRRQA